MDIIHDLKQAARTLQRQAIRGDAAAITRLGALPELREADGSTAIARLRRRHCLAVVAGELGFQGWSHATAVLVHGSTGDFGTLLCPPHCAVHWNIWSADLAEARAIRAGHGGYLLAYRRQFLIVDRHYIESLGLDADDPDWAAIGRDWTVAGPSPARQRLYARLIRGRRVMAG